MERRLDSFIHLLLFFLQPNTKVRLPLTWWKSAKLYWVHSFFFSFWFFTCIIWACKELCVPLPAINKTHSIDFPYATNDQSNAKNRFSLLTMRRQLCLWNNTIDVSVPPPGCLYTSLYALCLYTDTISMSPSFCVFYAVAFPQRYEHQTFWPYLSMWAIFAYWQPVLLKRHIRGNMCSAGAWSWSGVTFSYRRGCFSG